MSHFLSKRLHAAQVLHLSRKPGAQSDAEVWLLESALLSRCSSALLRYRNRFPDAAQLHLLKRKGGVTVVLFPGFSCKQSPFSTRTLDCKHMWPLLLTLLALIYSPLLNRSPQVVS